MKKSLTFFTIAALSITFLSSETSGRGGRGGGGGGGRAVGGGGSFQSYGGGGGMGARAGGQVVGPNRGSVSAGRATGSHTTQRGSTIDYRGAAAGRTTPGGVSGGKYVGGVQVTTPGGRELNRVGAGAGVVGPGGNAIGGKSGATVGSGPGGSFANRYQGGVAIGPHGAVAGGQRAGIAAGPGGVVAGGGRASAAVGPYGAVGGRTAFAAGAHNTVYRSSATVRTQGVYVRGAVASHPCFRPNWYRQYPGAWVAAGWTANTVWRASSWNTCASYCGYAEAPIYYDYGSTVVYDNDTVFVDGRPTASAEDYAKQATALADAGRDAKASKDDEWLPLGVFAMVQGEEKASNHIFQIAVSKDGVLRGNYYDAVTDSTSLIYGSVDKKTQRAAWTVADRKTPVYEVGVANLTKDETSMMVHYGVERSVQYTLVRIEEPDQKKE